MTDVQPLEGSDGDEPGIVSVLIPLYNHEKSVGEALDSVLESDCGRIELIVSDDASSDASFERARAWIERHGRHFHRAEAVRQPRNVGITGNLNSLIARARGEYITLLASDDKLTPKAVDAQRGYLESNPDKDFVFANVGKIDPDGRISGSSFVSDRRAAFITRRRTCATFDVLFNWDLTWVRLFARRAAFLRLGSYIEDHSFEDRWCALKIVETGRFGYLHQVVHLYRARKSGTGTAGIDLQRILSDLWDVEHLLVRESSGLLKVLLWMRARSFRRAGGAGPDRIFWLIVRRSIGALHRLLLDQRASPP